MMLIIAGGRTYQLTDVDYARLDEINEETPVTKVISGTAKGADTGGEEWAASRGIPIKRFKPDWDKWGLSAGHRRNADMADYVAPDGGAVVFPGGKGSANMVENAKKRNIRLWDWRNT